EMTSARGDQSMLRDINRKTVARAMSALPPKADICSAQANVRFGPKADIEPFRPQALICSLVVEDVVSRQRAANALKCKIADRFNRYVLLYGHQHAGANQDLSGLGFVAQPRRNIGYRSDGGIIEAPLKADSAERRKSMRDPNAEANVVPKLTPLLNQSFDGRSHFNRHQYCLESGVIDRNWVIEDHHHPITSIAFKRAAIRVYDLTNGRMVFTQQPNHLFRIRT